MKPGTRVQIKGLVNSPQHNGMMGLVKRSPPTERDRVRIKLDAGGNILAVKPENLEVIGPEIEYKEGRIVYNDVTCIRVHPSVTKIEDEAFKDCKLLNQVVFNEGLKKIGKNAFEDCNSLESITLPSTVTDIGKRAFTSCVNLREVVFNEGLKYIGHYSFWDCKSLQSITIPSSIKFIGREAFDECENLNEVVLNIPREIKFNSFRNCESLEGFKFSITPRVNAIVQSGLTDIENKMYQIPGLQRSGGIVQWSPGNELYVSRRTMRGGENWPEIRSVLDKINAWVIYYEMREATTLFELALWKSKIDQTDKTSDVSRRAYRIEVPGPVKDAILQFLGSADADDNSMESDSDDNSSSSEDEEDSDGSFTDRMMNYFEHQAGVPDPFGY